MSNTQSAVGDCAPRWDLLFLHDADEDTALSFHATIVELWSDDQHYGEYALVAQLTHDGRHDDYRAFFPSRDAAIQWTVGMAVAYALHDPEQVHAEHLAQQQQKNTSKPDL